MLEGVMRKEMAIYVAADDSVDARKRNEVGIRADRIERVELDATQLRQQLAHTRGTAKRRSSKPMVRNKKPRGLGA
jgi:hypothetical protein